MGLVGRVVANLQAATANQGATAAAAAAAGTSGTAAGGGREDVAASTRAAMANAVNAALVHPMKAAAAQHLASWQEGAGARRSSSASRWAPAPLAAPCVQPAGEAGAAAGGAGLAAAGGQIGVAVAPGELLLTVVVGRPRREHTLVMLELQVGSGRVGWGGVGNRCKQAKPGACLCPPLLASCGSSQTAIYVSCAATIFLFPSCLCHRVADVLLYVSPICRSCAVCCSSPCPPAGAPGAGQHPAERAA
jgi:hypothetical protein